MRRIHICSIFGCGAIELLNHIKIGCVSQWNLVDCELLTWLHSAKFFTNSFHYFFLFRIVATMKLSKWALIINSLQMLRLTAGEWIENYFRWTISEKTLLKLKCCAHLMQASFCFRHTRNTQSPARIRNANEKRWALIQISLNLCWHFWELIKVNVLVKIHVRRWPNL